jgi:pimeloyl-ACP methyl ester carboxylesterase
MRIIERVKALWHRAVLALTPSGIAWSGAATGIVVLGTGLIFLFLLTGLLQNFAVQKVPAFVVLIGVLALLGIAVMLVAAIIMRLPFRYRLALALFAPFILIAVFPGDVTSRLSGGAMLILTVSLLGAGIAVFRQAGFRPREQKVTLTAAVLGFGGLLGGAYVVFSDFESANPALDGYVLEDRTLDLSNPGLPGEYEVVTLTYGSGKDLHRKEFAEEVDVVSRRVDGTPFIDNWDGLSGWLRTSYWGFDVTELPLQARVWMPQGEGPFPLVLIVHGNHSMEDFSDPGYQYLGELFASRGIILASVDQNFINYTASASVEVFDKRPGLKEENDARGWLLLEHLAQWRDWNQEPGHALQNKVDVDRVALIGHSRGGEAVGVAAAFNALDRYPDDATVDFDFNFNLRGVIAIAPVDGQYQPRERPTPIRDVNYFTIHGSMDGDVQSFDGMAQYSRVEFSGEDYGFRSGLYVVGANHGQFNTTWGNVDVGLFHAWALDVDRIMDAEAQRDVARVYFGAFLEIVLNDRREYLPIFRDARYAAEWLPNTFFINQFSDTEEQIVAAFEEDIDPSTMPGGRISTQNLSRWYETGNELKYDELDTHSLVVAWDAEFSEETARVDFELDRPVAVNTVIASLSAVDIDTMPVDWEDESDANESADEAVDPLDWTIELTDRRGLTASAALSADAQLYPLVTAIPRRARFLESTEPAEVLFRRFELPLDRFANSDPDFDAASIAKISFVFDASERGAIILDDLSVAQELKSADISK